MTDFLSQLLGNPIRARALRVLISNKDEEMTASQVAKRSAGGVPSILRELQKLKALGIVKRIRGAVIVQKKAAKKGKKKKGKAMRVVKKRMEDKWALDHTFRHLRALSMFVHEVSPSHFRDVERALKGTGRLSAVILSGVFVGDPSRPTDLLIAGDALNERRLERVVRDLEPKFGREIRYTTFSTPEFRYRLSIQDRLIRDTLDFPHRILLNRTRIF